MPKDTFFNLDKEKQSRIIAAAKKEFSEQPLQEASIAKIIKMADISRGSFYQYFEDKEDLYYYFFQTLRKDSQQTLEYQLSLHNGDLFAAAKSYFKIWVKEAFESDNAAFYRNLFMHMDYRGTTRVSPEIAQEESVNEKQQKRHSEHKKKVAQLMDIIDTTTLKFQSNDELVLLIKTVTGMMFSSINHAYKVEMRHGQVDLTEVTQEFDTKLDWIQYGVAKNNEK